MAFITEIYCHACHESKREVLDLDNPHQCRACASLKKTKAEREWKAGREGLTLEERIRELENFMYHHGTHYKPVVFG